MLQWMGSGRRAVDSEYLVVLVAVSDVDTGVQLGRRLVEERLAACVQVMPSGTAIYRWQGELYTEPQVQLLIKTRKSVWQSLCARLVELHPDKVPEILALPVVDGLPEYLSWLGESTGEPGAVG